MRNVVQSPQVSLLFLIPGVSITLRVNGRAQISSDPDLIAPFEIRGKLPKLVLIIHVEVRAKLWDQSTYQSAETVPTLGELMLHHRKMPTEEVNRVENTITKDLDDSMY